MSSPPHPYVSQLAQEKGNARKRDRPPALELLATQAASDSQVRYEHAHPDDGAYQVFLLFVRFICISFTLHQPHIADAEGIATELDSGVSRSASVTSSLDPYYFGIQTPSDSPVPPLPLHTAASPDIQSTAEPVTPAKDPSTIDRHGLVGVGELMTPRWARAEDDVRHGSRGSESDMEGSEVFAPNEDEDDAPDSPWTIEAIDGECDERAELQEQDQVRNQNNICIVD